MDLKSRVTNILKSPTTEWQVIAAEPSDAAGLYRDYIMVLAAIPPVAGLIGSTVFGFHGYHMRFGGALTFAILSYLLALAGVYVLALIIAKLAPTFSGVDNTDRALKLAAYAATASWVGGIFRILPFLAVLSIAASIYSLYLLYTGLPVLMQAPPEKSFGYALAVIVAAIVLFLVIGLFIGLFVTMPMMMM